MLKTLKDLTHRILELNRPPKEEIVVEFRLKDGATKNGRIVALDRPRGASKVVLFVEE